MIYNNGVYREETPEEIAERERLQEKWEQEQSQNPAPPTEAERISELENWREEVEKSYKKGVNEA